MNLKISLGLTWNPRDFTTEQPTQSESRSESQSPPTGPPAAPKWAADRRSRKAEQLPCTSCTHLSPTSQQARGPHLKATACIPMFTGLRPSRFPTRRPTPQGARACATPRPPAGIGSCRPPPLAARASTGGASRVGRVRRPHLPVPRLPHRRRRRRVSSCPHPPSQTRGSAAHPRAR